MGHGGKKRNTAACKKRSRNNQRQKDIRSKRAGCVDLKEAGCNQLMTCDACGRQQRNRAFCYFCSAVQRLPMCAHCSRTKCLGADCVIPHYGKSATGMALVGAVCDFCEAWVCHSRRCLEVHSCQCPIADSECVVCERTVWEHGGRMFRCFTCDAWICEDDQMEHQATCQVLETETDHCISCNKRGTWSCVKCKINFCDNHVKSKIANVNVKKGEAYRCKRCAAPLQEANLLSMSTRKHEFGRQTRDAASSGYYSNRVANLSGQGDGDDVGGDMERLRIDEEGDDDDDYDSDYDSDDDYYDSDDEGDEDDDEEEEVEEKDKGKEGGKDGKESGGAGASGSGGPSKGCL